MHRRSSPVRITVTLPATDHRIYESAARVLRRIMRAQAPDAAALIQSKLVKHDATGLVEDYLDLVAWPHADRPLILRGSGARARETVRLKFPTRAARPPADPSRN